MTGQNRWRRVRAGEWAHPQFGTPVHYDTGWTHYPYGLTGRPTAGRYRTLREAQLGAALHALQDSPWQTGKRQT